MKVRERARAGRCLAAAVVALVVSVSCGGTTTESDRVDASTAGGSDSTATDAFDVGAAQSGTDTAAAEDDATDSDEDARTDATSAADEAADDVSTNTSTNAPTGDATSTPAGDPTSAAATSPADAPPRSFTLLAGGEILPHSPLWRGAAANAGGTGGYDFTPMLAPIADRVEAADLSICHLETPIAPEGEEFSTDPLYGVPPQIADAIAAAGFDRCSTASNHVLDRYPRGVDRTVDVLEAAGVAQSGMARFPAEIEPSLVDVDGVAVSHLAYTYGTNGIPPPADQPWRTRLLSAEQIIADAQAAHDLGAEFVVVSVHWGTEKQAAPDDQQVLIAEQITATGLVDLVIGHHAHVLQPIALVNGVWVVYGLGNLLSNHPVADHWPASTQDGALVEFEVSIDGDATLLVGRPNVIPT
ncbi:MAG: CapA family protein, partial [Actinomycetota bacterium]